MNVKTVVTALKPLENHRIIILANTKPRGFVHAQRCITVDHLPPDQRQHDQGNVVLWDGRFTPEGLQAGITFWAKGVRTITWGCDHIVAHIYPRSNSAKFSIVKQWKIDKQGEHR